MARQRKKKKKSDKNGWLNTYADMITLILVFFILLYSMSTIDQEKYQMLVKAFTRDPETLEKIRLEENEIEDGNLDPAEGGFEDDEIAEIEVFDDLYEYLRSYIKRNNLEHSVQVERGENIVYVRFMSTLFFEPDKAVLKAGGREILDYVGVALARAESLARFIRIDGHTAEASRGREVVNDRDLSTKRANEVLKYLESEYIEDPSKLVAVGYGMYRPIAPNISEANRAKNRRVELIVGRNDRLQEEIDRIYSLSQENAGFNTEDSE